jgi:hypothetical protein
MADQRLSIRKYAERSGVSPSYISKLIKRGVIQKTDDGKIDPEAADAAWERSKDPRSGNRGRGRQQAEPQTQAPPSPVEGDQAVAERPAAATGQRPDPVPDPSTGAVLSQADAVALDTQWRGYLRMLDAMERERRLIKRDEVEEIMTSAMVIASTQMDGLGGRLAQQLAGESDPAVIRQTILDESRRIRATIAEELERLGDFAGDGGGDAAAAGEDGGPVGGKE